MMRVSKPMQVILFITVLVIVWQAYVSASKMPDFILPGPYSVAYSFATHFRSLSYDASATMYESVLGFALATAVGVAIAVGIVMVPFVRNAVYPTIVGFNALPKVALAPLLVVWFGLGFNSKIVMSFVISFLPIVITTIAGMERIDPDLMNFIFSLKAPRSKILTKIRLPHAIPFIFDGMKVAIVLTVVGSIVGEFVSANVGLGATILVASQVFNNDLVFAALLYTMIITLVLFYVLVFAEKLLVKWTPETRGS